MSWPEANENLTSKSIAGQNPLLASFKMPSKTSKHGRTSRGEEELLNEIHDFSNQLRTNLVPQFEEVTGKLATSLTSFNDQLQRLKEVHEQAQVMVESFEEQVTTNEDVMNDQLVHIREWKGPGAQIENMKARVDKLKVTLASSKERLIALDGIMREAEADDQQRVTQLKIVGRSVLVIAVLVIAIAYNFLFIRWTR